MTYPIFSIAIATFNSEKTLQGCLDSIKKQTYPQNKIEILIIDGGSKDKTIKIAKKYKCKIIPNPKTEIINAKQIGFAAAKGKYLMYLDSDEVLENANSLKLKYRVFASEDKIKSILISGYKTPANYAPINYYINDFGDPFSYFVFRESKGDEYLLPELKSKYSKLSETKEAVVFNFKGKKSLPLIELFAGGCAIDLAYCRKNFPQIIKNPEQIALLFYLLNKKGCHLGVMKNDPTIHYSTPNVNKYLKKISSRVKNNIFLTQMGKSGYSGREQFQDTQTRWKKYLFLPYAFLIVLPIYDATRMVIFKRKLVYLWHIPLSFYTAYLIVYFYIIKTINPAQRIAPYGS